MSTHCAAHVSLISAQGHGSSGTVVTSHVPIILRLSNEIRSCHGVVNLATAPVRASLMVACFVVRTRALHTPESSCTLRPKRHGLLRAHFATTNFQTR